MANAANDVAKQLAAASKDLLYPSDSEAPFEPVLWPPGPQDARAAVAANGHPPAGAKIEEVSPADFFGELPGDAKFAALQQTLQKALPGYQILRVGEVKVAIYLIGKLADGAWAGLKTTSVES
jgi:hypothetical protein